MTIKGQIDPYQDPAWWPPVVLRRVESVLPSGYGAVVRHELFENRLVVSLSESWPRRWARRLRAGRDRRERVATRVLIELADAPVGVCVMVRWL